jgi:o-succinylbenzoate synthase
MLSMVLEGTRLTGQRSDQAQAVVTPAAPDTRAGRVTDVETRVVSVDYRRPFGISSGTSPRLESIAVTVHTTSGVTGLGEAAPMTAYTGEHLPGVIAGIEVLAAAIRGLEAAEIRAAHNAMDAALRENRLAKAALDMALHDVTARALGVPVTTLLGGAVRREVPLAWVIGLDDVDAVVREAVTYAGSGFTHIKVKGGVHPDRDVQLVTALRNALPQHVELSLDANEGYDRSTARRTLARMEDAGLDMVEQPLPRWDITGMALLTEQLQLSVIADESIQSVPDALTVVQRRAADVVNIKLLKLGGFRAACDVAAIAGAAGLRIKVGSMPELGVATLAAAHLAAVLPHATMPADLVGPLMVDGDPFLDDASGFVTGGTFRVPDGPGLGIGEADIGRSQDVG